jgi:hypothetical protein
LNSDIRAKFERKLEDKFKVCEEAKANILSEKIVSTLNEIAEDVVPKKAKKSVTKHGEMTRHLILYLKLDPIVQEEVLNGKEQLN